MAASDPTPYVATPTGTLQGVAAFSWDGSAWQPSGRAGPDVATATGVLQGVAPFSWSGSAWTPAGGAQPGVATPSGVLDGVAVYTWSGSAWTPASGTATPATPSGALRGVAAFAWDGAAWQPSGQAGPSVPTPYGVLQGVAMFEWGGSTWQAGAAVPAGATLDLSFLSGALDPRITFTRASTATYFDVTGTMQTAATNAPRFDYDPVTHAARGLLLEEARTNSVTHSATLADHTPTAATRTLNATVAPDGTTTGTLLTEDGTNAEHYMDFSFVPTGSTTYTGSCFVKAGTRTQVSIQGRVNGNWAGGNAEMLADLTLGTIVVLTGAPTGTITLVGNGWYRITFTVNSTASPAGSSLFRVALASGGQVLYQGNGTGNAYFWGCQLEVGGFVTSYIPTTAAAVTRSADACSMPVAAWFTAAQGSMMADFDAAGFATCPAGFSDGTTNNMFYFRQVGDVQTAVAGVAKGVTGTPWNTYPVGNKIAGCYQAGRLAGAANGGAVATDNTLAAGPFLWSTRLSLGCSPWGLDSPIDGHLRRVRYWPRVLSNAELQSVTT